MLTVYVLAGIPGAGKTHWAKEFIKKYPRTFYISTDDLRKELTGEEQCVDPGENEMIHEAAALKLKNFAYLWAKHQMRFDGVIFDATNCETDEWERLKDALRTHPVKWVLIWFNVTPEEAMVNQATRERKVPLEIVEMKWQKLMKTSFGWPRYFDACIPQAVNKQIFIA